MKVVCSCCSLEFEKKGSEIKKSKTGKHYCSKSCSAKINNRGRQRNRAKARTCKHCKGEYRTSNGHKSVILCQKCSEKHRDKTNALKALTIGEYNRRNAKSIKHTSWTYAAIRTLNRSWNKEMLLLGCASCGYSKHVELAHRKAVSEFSKDALLGEVNSKENVVQLCRNCHWEFDHLSLKV